MINKRAIEKYLRGSTNSYDWLKGEPLKAVNRALAELQSPIQFDELWAHQKVCLLLLESLHRFMLHVDMGGGKTRTCLKLIEHRKAIGEKPKAVIFVPYITAVETWAEEVAEFVPSLRCEALTGTTDQNLDTLLSAKADIFVICYQSAVAMLAEPVAGKRKSKKKWTLDPKRVREVFSGCDTLIMDEVHKCKSVSSLTYRMCRAISAQAQYSIGLTGTPFGKDLTDLWPQFYLIDFGETLGPTLGFYRSVFFNQKINFWGGYEYKFNKKLFPDLQRKIKNRSIRFSIEELHDLPPFKRIPKIINPPEGIKAYADKAIATLKDSVTTKKSYRVVESQYLQLRQLSSGFMTLKGEDNDKIQIQFDNNPKLDILQDLVEAMPHDCKMVVYHHFIYTNSLISQRLKDMGVGHARIWGGQRDPIGELRKFKQNQGCRVLVINSKSGSSSLNLQLANYLVFFEEPDSPIDRQQAERRVWRPGQGKRVFAYSLMMKGTADVQLNRNNKLGRNMLKSLLDGSTEL